MKKYIRVALASTMVLAMAGPAVAQDNAAAGQTYQGADGTVFKSLVAAGIYFGVKYQCKDLTLTSTVISAAIADCCVAGDMWRVAIWRGNANARFATSANVSEFVAGGPAYPPDVFSPDATVLGKVSGVHVLATAGNTLPAGLPAGGTLRITTNGGAATCTRKQLRGGTATS